MLLLLDPLGSTARSTHGLDSFYLVCSLSPDIIQHGNAVSTVIPLTTMVHIILHHQMMIDRHDDPASYVDISTLSDDAISTYVTISSYAVISFYVVRASYDDF